jgi:hypothetical protein
LLAACSRLTIHGNLEFAGTVLAADRVSARVGHLEGVRSLGDVRSLGHSSILGAGGPPSDNSASAILESPAHFHGKVILDCDHNVVLETTPPSVLKLPVDWPVTKVSALSRITHRLQYSGQSAPTGHRMATRQLASRRIDLALENGTAGVALAVIVKGRCTVRSQCG